MTTRLEARSVAGVDRDGLLHVEGMIGFAPRATSAASPSAHPRENVEGRFVAYYE